MVDGVNQKDLLLLSRYSKNLPEDENEIQDSSADNFLFGVGGLKAWEGRKWYKDNKSIFGSAKNTLSNLHTVEKGLKGSTFGETYGNFKRFSKLDELSRMYKAMPNPASTPTPAPTPAAAPGTPGTAQNTGWLKRLKNWYTEQKEAKKAAHELERIAKETKAFNKSEYYKNVRTLIEEAKGLKGKRYQAKLNEINKAVIKANAEVHKARIAGNLKPAKWYGKAGNALKKATGMNAIISKTDKLLKSSKGLQKAAKFTRGKGVLTAVAIVPEALNIGETYTKLGAGKGTKQLLKSSAIVGTELLTYAAGMKAGAAIGAAVGSVFPGAGTIVGGILGAGIGLAGSYFAGKGMEKLLGKSELEKAKDEEAAALAKAASKNPEDLEGLLKDVQNTASLNPQNIPDNVSQAYANAANEYYKQNKDENETSASINNSKTSSALNKGLSEELKRTKERLLAYAEAMGKSFYGNTDDWNSTTQSPMMMNMGMMNMFNPPMSFGNTMGSYLG